MRLDRIMSEIEREGREREGSERDRERQIRDRETETRRERDFGLDLVFCMSSIS